MLLHTPFGPISEPDSTPEDPDESSASAGADGTQFGVASARHGIRQSARILIVDDDLIANNELENWLTREGMSVATESSNEIAASILAVLGFDLVFVNTAHLVADRRLWLGLLLSHRDCPPIIATTSATALRHAMRSVDLPLAGYLVTPIEFDKLRWRIRQLMDW